MIIVVTGNLGYVGAVCVQHLRRALPDAAIAGIDSALFAQCPIQGTAPDSLPDVQFYRDVRDLHADSFSGVDAVIHLAAVSNAPMASRPEAVTQEINNLAAVQMGRATGQERVCTSV